MGSSRPSRWTREHAAGAENLSPVAFWWARGSGQCEERAQNLYDVVCLILLIKINCTYSAQYY